MQAGTAESKHTRAYAINRLVPVVSDDDEGSAAGKTMPSLYLGMGGGAFFAACDQHHW